MIDIKLLNDNDFGKWVEYKTTHKRKKGRIKSWNNKYIFVVYHCVDDWKHFDLYTGRATDPKDLRFI